MVHDDLVGVLIRREEVFVHVRVELLDAAVDDHGRSLDTEVPRDLGTLLDVGPEGFCLCSCVVDLVALVPLPQVLLDRLWWARRE